MNLLIGTTAVELNFKNREAALLTRALIVMAYEEMEMSAWLNWEKLLREYPYIKKAYEAAK